MKVHLLVVFALVLVFTGCGGGSDAAHSPQEVAESVPKSTPVLSDDENLEVQFASIAKEAQGDVGVFALLIEDGRSAFHERGKRFAMQSVVKLPVAMAVLELVSEGKFTLRDRIEFSKYELVNPNQRSPLRDRSPNGGVTTILDLLNLAIVESDGTACDVLTRLAGGPAGVQTYVDSLGVRGIEMKRTHKEFGTNWESQYENWATPEAIVELLVQLHKWVEKERESEARNPVPNETKMLTGMQLLENFMFLSKPGQNRLKGLLPDTARVAHKTGTGGTRDGVTSATNDVGIITLPNGKHIAIAVFVGDSKADEKTREAVIAKTAKAAWDAWNK